MIKMIKMTKMIKIIKMIKMIVQRIYPIRVQRRAGVFGTWYEAAGMSEKAHLRQRQTQIHQSVQVKVFNYEFTHKSYIS